MARTDPVTSNQLSYIASLVAKKDLSKLDPVKRAWLLDDPDNPKRFNRGQASDCIQELVALDWLPKPVSDKPLPTELDMTVPGESEPNPQLNMGSPDMDSAGFQSPPVASVIREPCAEITERDITDTFTDVQLGLQNGKGYYFIVDPTSDEERFFRVTRPTKESGSRWYGFTFIETQASDDFYKVTDRKRKLAILNTIAENPIKAQNEYGIRLGVCGVCGRTLTARDSRLRGIGPICASRIPVDMSQGALSLDFISDLINKTEGGDD